MTFVVFSDPWSSDQSSSIYGASVTQVVFACFSGSCFLCRGILTQLFVVRVCECVFKEIPHMYKRPHQSAGVCLEKSEEDFIDVLF